MVDFAALRVKQQYGRLVTDVLGDPTCQKTNDDEPDKTCGGPYGQFVADLQGDPCTANSTEEDSATSSVAVDTAVEKAVLSSATVLLNDPENKRSFELSEQQNKGLSLIEEWLEDPSRQEFHLGGYAGTGKTVTIAELSKRLDAKRMQHEIASFTGKAVSVLKKKGLWQARTLHNLLYKFSYDPYAKKYVMEKQPSLYGAKLVIVDEASMVSTSLYEDLKEHGVKMLFVGDPAQLEPVGDNPNLVRNCDFVFTEIHRQANKSPILRMAQAVRRGTVTTPPLGEWVRDSGTLIVTDEMDEIEDKYDVVICGKNATRHRINKLRRQQREYNEEVLYEGETVICLKNDRERGIFNGMTFKVKKIHKGSFFRSTDKVLYCDLEDDLGVVKEDIPVATEFFGKDYKREKDHNRNAIAFDYGYVLTAHKSQGSEWDTVLVVDEPVWGCDSARWRYTALTRCAKNLTYLL